MSRRIHRWINADYANIGLRKDKEDQAMKGVAGFQNGKPYEPGSLPLKSMITKVTLMSKAVKFYGTKDKAVDIFNVSDGRNGDTEMGDSGESSTSGDTRGNTAENMTASTAGVTRGWIGQVVSPSAADQLLKQSFAIFIANFRRPSKLHI
ncbi:uncharacterized protein BDR25DRAFT_315699 [Lindgomyces ingoldianus]|uniref:Uncharacterized protein n=1 Tax=Lindgomyces ingoldianus TaxID=673940 RepID=A0ACB6QP12_9PLEO|nr:uncharacterized protein BDR25DRAFT_315699 [Lindgomyces ingoldianus]KAF2468708.1 hypothetical protein BDR25DRAFT_315699 [Lindgomyces ingoldianus]